MSNSKEVASLKKELEALQKEIDGSKTPASVASYGTMDSTEPVDEDVSLGTSAIASPEFGPGGTGASGALANAALPAKDEQQPSSSNTTNADTPRTGTATQGDADASNNSDGKQEGEEEPTIAMKRDQSIPSLKLDDYETESSNQSQAESNSNDAMSDSSAVVVNAEDGQPQT